MKYVRTYTGPDGETHFEDVEVELTERGTSYLSEVVPATGMLFRRVTTEYDTGFHTIAQRQFVINLVGEVEITVSDGEVRRLGPGSIMLAEDTTGKGHRSRAVGSERLNLFIQLPVREPGSSIF